MVLLLNLSIALKIVIQSFRQKEISKTFRLNNLKSKLWKVTKNYLNATIKEIIGKYIAIYHKIYLRYL